MKASDRFSVDGVFCRMNGLMLPIANLSVGGFFVVTAAQPIEGQFIELEMELAGRQPFRLVGKVTWINNPEVPKAPALPRGFGVKITRIAFTDKLAILNVLRRAKPLGDRRRATRA